MTLEELVHEIYEKPMAPEEFERQLALALADREEMEAIQDQIRWFKRRYPTAGERLRWARRTYDQWMRSHPSRKTVRT
jgi:hypothetical protein